MKRAAKSCNLFGYPRVQRRGASGWSAKTTAAESRAERKRERQQAKSEVLQTKREAKDYDEEAKQTQIEIQEEYAYNTGARHRREGKKPQHGSARLVGATKYLGVVKASALARKAYMEGYRGASNPCANTRKSNVSDRAKRYRANQPGCRPAGLKKCKLCGSRSDVMVDHIDGNESNGKKSNLRWLCRSCNNTLGAEMAKARQGRRTVQYNPKEHKGAQTLGEYTLAVLEHTRHAHDRAGKIIHETPKAKRREFAQEIWERRQKGTAASAGYGDAPDWVTNPEEKSLVDKAIATARRSAKKHNKPVIIVWTAYGLALFFDGQKRIAFAQPYIRVTPDGSASDVMTGGRENPQDGPDGTSRSNTEYQLGYNLGQADRQSAQRPKTAGELYQIFGANFGGQHPTRIEQFHNAYQLGYGPVRSQGRRNPETGSDSEYEQAKRIAELFHGRPVKEEIEVTDEIRSHDWYAYIGPLVELRVKALKGSPFRTAKFKFNLKGDEVVNLMTSPDGRQFYLRGGDQEIDLEALGMGEGSDWFRDHMVIGLVTYIAYRDQKKFHGFTPTEYTHKIGSALDWTGTKHIQKTNVKPILEFDTLSKKLRIVGGLGKVETETLVDGMSPGIVN